MRYTNIGLASLVFLAANAMSQNIETISVTTTRTTQAVSDLSANHTHIEQSVIADINAQHINQVLSRVAGAWISRGNGQEHLTALRSPVLTGAGGCGAFFMAQDGISVRAPGFCNTNQLFDLNTEQAGGIDVVLGPASVTYGSNAVHGIINVLTPDVFSTAPVYVALENGPHDYINGKLALSKTYDTHAFGVFTNATHDGGYKQDSGFDQQKITFIHQYREGDWDVKNVVAASNLNQETAGFITGFNAFSDPELKASNPNPEAFRDNQSLRAYSKIAYRLDGSTTLYISPYIRWSEMTFLQHFLPWQPTETNRQKSVGLQMQANRVFNDVTLIGGLDSDFTQGELNENQEALFSATLPAGEHYDYQVDGTSFSPFIKAIWQVNPQLSFDAGLRYERTKYDYDNLLSDGSACAEGVENCRFTRPFDQTVAFNESSYQLGFNYQTTSSSNVFGQFSTGYRAPQATELFRLQGGQTITELDAESIEGWELGWRLSGNALQLEVVAFDMKKDNFIFQDTDRRNISDGSTRHHGVEASVNYDLSDTWYLGFNGTLAKHRYTSDLTLSRTSIKGNEIDTAPEHMASMQLGWQNARGDSFEIEWLHQGNYFLDPQNTASYAGHNLVHLRAGYQISPAWHASLRLLNLTNVDYAERADFGFGSYRYFVGEPRSLFASIAFTL